MSKQTEWFILEQAKARQEPHQEERLYPTEKEERHTRELKERYGIKDALTAKREAGND